MALKYDSTINAGHILTSVAMLVAAIGAVAMVQADLGKLTQDQQRLEATFTSEILSIRAEASARESRLRTVEMLQAGQASDLRNIQSGISRIEGQLERVVRATQ